MRRAVVVVVASCYSPAPQPGTPCPDGTTCPTGLECSPATLTCELVAVDPTVDGPPDTDTNNATCDPLSDPAFGSVSLTNGGNFPSTATFTCATGFVLTGSPSATCAEDGSWSAASPTCDWTGPRAFTTCAQTGPTGPSQSQCDTAYTGTTLATEVTLADGFQRWTVPATASYRIVVNGAAGGTLGGFFGAHIEGTFALTAGTVLKIVAGQLPTGALAGGGGSFVTRLDNTPLIIAGGAGAGTCTTCVAAETGGRVETSGGTIGAVARADDGGGGPSGNAASGGGGGLLGDGASSGGKAFVNGATGATGMTGIFGGFGGGGARNAANGAGAGGGYSGGSGNTTGTDTSIRFGGGGGSFNNGTDQVATPNSNNAPGSVTIDLIP